MGDPIRVTMGICAYNEVANIERAIRSASEQALDGFELEEIIVVSSESTDGTDDVVKNLMSEISSVRLIRQEKREGKNSAVNRFLDEKKTKIVVIMNADTIFIDKNCLQHLLAPLIDDEAGIVGGHPIPTNDTKTIAGFASHMIWNMHHHVSLISPQIGEIIAFRDIGTRLSINNSGDEGTLKMEIEKAGYKSIYAPEAKVWNKGPETTSDFLKQRTRVNIGERIMKKEQDYDLPTWSFKNLYSAYIETIKDLGFHPIKILAATSMEFYSRLKALIHVRSNKGDIGAWEPIKTTKKI
ncbi:MAG: glycosyltransferase [Candidatus Methanoplasma sp.]|nr:glycosyltransferase [Candidatus Methanoplasma sp.]